MNMVQTVGVIITTDRGTHGRVRPSGAMEASAC